MAANLRNGLHLKGKTIHRINGPCSMYYLKPNRETYLEYRERGVELPILLLFGDIHQYRTGMCESCECEEKGSSCCVGLHMPAFLEEIDEMAKKTPVDFFTEFSTELEKTANQHTNVLFGDFHQALKSCYRVSKRSHPNGAKECPTEAIRFHYADARFMENRIEGLSFHPYHVLFGLITRGLRNHPATVSDMKQASVYTLGEIDLHLDFSTDEEFALEEKGRAIGETLLRMITSDKDIATKTHEMTTYLFTQFEQVRGEKQSAIFRQLDKLGIQEWKDKSIWIEWMTENLLGMPVYQHYMKELDAALRDPRCIAFLDSLFPRFTYNPSKRLSDAEIKKRFASIYYPESKEHMEALHWAFTLYYTKVMDAYFLARLFKQPTENTSSTLSIGFFGDFHTRSMVQFLQQPLFGYETTVVASTDLVAYNDPRISRCVTIHHSIDLYHDVQEHHRLRFGDAHRKGLLLRYKNRLQREKNGRTAHRNRSTAVNRTNKKERNHRTNKNNRVDGKEW